eukprot:2348199-Lingulodinium_polyedra.AAC.1
MKQLPQRGQDILGHSNNWTIFSSVVTILPHLVLRQPCLSEPRWKVPYFVCIHRPSSGAGNSHTSKLASFIGMAPAPSSEELSPEDDDGESDASHTPPAAPPP